MALTAFTDTIFGERYGTEPPRVLALHGWGRDHRDFEPVLEGIPSIAVDLPGFGSSPMPPRALGAEGYAAMVATVLDRFSEPPVIIGHSFGGRVAVHLGTVHPVAALLLIGVPLVRRRTTRKPPAAYRVLRSLHRHGLLSDRRIEQARRRYGSADYRAAEGVMREVLVTAVQESYEPQLAALGCPVHLIWGAEDREVPLEIARRSLELLVDADLTVVPDVGHLVPVQAPAAVRAVLETVL